MRCGCGRGVGAGRVSRRKHLTVMHEPSRGWGVRMESWVVHGACRLSRPLGVRRRCVCVSVCLCVSVCVCVCLCVSCNLCTRPLGVRGRLSMLVSVCPVRVGR